MQVCGSKQGLVFDWARGQVRIGNIQYFWQLQKDVLGSLQNSIEELGGASYLGFPGDNILEIFKGTAKLFVQHFPTIILTAEGRNVSNLCAHFLSRFSLLHSFYGFVLLRISSDKL